MPFSELLGNEPVKLYLGQALEKKELANTLLFFGPRGVGKKEFARTLAEILLGENTRERIRSEQHPDFHCYRPEGKGGAHSIETVRQFLQKIYLPPFEAPCKVFLFYEAHRMLATSSNALLKTLEEPPLDSYICLLTDTPEEMLPTVLSRCHKVKFSLLTQEELTAFIQKKYSKTLEEARRMAFLAQGSLDRACALAEGKSAPFLPLLDKLLFPSLESPPLSPWETLNELEQSVLAQVDKEEEGNLLFQEIDQLLEAILLWYRDLTLLSHAGDPVYLFHKEASEKRISFESLPKLEEVFEWVTACRDATRCNVRLRVALEQLFLQLKKLS